MATIHELKSWPDFFEPVQSGAKQFELRRNDRKFQLGDILRLREWDEREERYTGREVDRRICFILEGAGHGCIEPLKGLAIGYAILGLMPTSSAFDLRHDPPPRPDPSVPFKKA
jgi:hypothetical protein